MKWLIWFALLSSLAHAAGLADERIWSGNNGKTFRGLYVRTLEGGKKVEIANTKGIVFTIEIANLIESDRDLIAGKQSPKARPSPLSEPGDASMFKPVPVLDRSLISVLPSEEQGVKWENLATCSVGTFFYWWNLCNWIEIPRRGDPEKKAQWLNDKLKRDINPRNTSVARTDDVMKGIAAYFEDHLEEVATYRFHLEPILNPANFVKYTRGGDACLLYASAGDYGVWMSLIDATENGDVTFSCFNKVLKAKWSPHKDPMTGYALNKSFTVPVAGGKPVKWRPLEPQRKPGGRKAPDLKKSTLTIQNREDLPSWLQDPDYTFILSPLSPMVVCRPHVFATKGKKCPPPAEPGFGVPLGK